MRNEKSILLLAIVAAIVAGSCGPEANAPDEGEPQQVAVTKQPLRGFIPCKEATWGGHGYRFCFDFRNWYDARLQCLRVGMDLVSIDSSGENAFVLAQAPLGTWIGGNDLAVEGHWVWASSNTHFWTGTSSGSAAPGQYANWKSNEPQNFFNEDVAVMEASSGKWIDLAPFWLGSFTCETNDDQCPSNPSKMTPGQCGCAVNDTDGDGDGVANCIDQCPLDASLTDAGDCGCPNSPAPSGTACDDGVCQGPGTCNGAGVCGNPSSCAPDTNCTYKLYEDRVFWFCSNARTWTAARNQCRTQPDVELASINDSYENQFVAKHFSALSWIGGNDRDSASRWRWSDKPFDSGEQFWTGDVGGVATPSTFTSWLAGEPSALWGEECSYLDPAADKRSRWLDGNCVFPLAFVCEQPADECPNNPSKRQPGICGCDVADTDSDGDGLPNCRDNCPQDPLRFEPGDCGCVGNPGNPAAGTACDDGVCSANTQCDGSGRCGTLAQCAPDTNCLATVRDRHVYWVCQNNRTWTDASTRCAAKTRTQLASLQLANENDFLTTQIVADAWVGGSDSVQESKWKWAGSTTQFWDGVANGDNYQGAFVWWALNEPNNGFNNEDCAMLQKSDGRWSDQACTLMRDFVCETCVPKSCAELGAQCGTIADGCGGTLNCTAQAGGCSPNEVCFPGVNRCSDADGSDCHDDVKVDPLLPPDEASRKFFADHAACTSDKIDRCQAAFLGGLRDDSLRITDACTSGGVTPGQHNTLNLDRNRKRRLWESDPTYRCRVADHDGDHDFIPDDNDLCPDTPPRTPTFDDGCTNPAVAPGPDADHMRFLRERERAMYDPDCVGVDMDFMPQTFMFQSPPGLGEAVLHYRTMNQPPGCDLIVEVRADALLTNNTRSSYNFLFNINEGQLSHTIEISYVSFLTTDPGDRGALAAAQYKDLIYSIRVRNGSGAVTPWSEPAHAGTQ